MHRAKPTPQQVLAVYLLILICITSISKGMEQKAFLQAGSDLHEAVKSGEREKVINLLLAGADSNYIDS